MAPICKLIYGTTSNIWLNVLAHKYTKCSNCIPHTLFGFSKQNLIEFITDIVTKNVKQNTEEFRNTVLHDHKNYEFTIHVYVAPMIFAPFLNTCVTVRCNLFFILKLFLYNPQFTGCESQPVVTTHNLSCRESIAVS